MRLTPGCNLRPRMSEFGNPRPTRTIRTTSPQLVSAIGTDATRRRSGIARRPCASLLPWPGMHSSRCGSKHISQTLASTSIWKRRTLPLRHGRHAARTTPQDGTVSRSEDVMTMVEIRAVLCRDAALRHARRDDVGATAGWLGVQSRQPCAPCGCELGSRSHRQVPHSRPPRLPIHHGIAHPSRLVLPVRSGV